ncbi:MAG TPA: hypothetical protein VJ925_10620 [Longimicrobiales bacterium]|nr:hypothetical protein [Longimicrobiales bacterium]
MSGALLAGALGAAAPLEGQEQACVRGVVEEIVVRNGTVVPEEDIPDGILGWGPRLANRLHIRTRKSFIRAELLLDEGDCYDPFLVEDSERILRRYGFISNAEVFAVRIDTDTEADAAASEARWRIEVETRDEWSTRLEITAEFDNGFQLRSAALAETNVLGLGATLRGFLVEDDAQRLLGAQAGLPRLFGTRANLAGSWGTTRIGEFRAVEVSYPFVGEVGHWAWQVGASDVEDYFSYSFGETGAPARVLLPTRDQSASATIARRFGEPGDLSVVGLNLARETLDFPGYPDAVDIVEGNGFDETVTAPADLAEALRAQTRFGAGTRLSVLLGQRNISFVQRTGLDALRGVQDIEVGTDISLTLGRTIRGGIGERDVDDLLVRFRWYGATAPTPWVVVSRISLQGRQIFFDPEFDRSGWRDVLAEFDLLAYWQPPSLPSHTVLGRVSATGGWTVDLPYQLTLGGRRAVRGFDDADLPGARRVVFTAEDRIYFGWPFPETFDLGATLFADVGRIWPGGVPFGVDSGWRGTVGAGLRFGFPTGSRGVIRLDLAHAIGPEASANGPILRITAVDLIGLTGGLSDLQLLRSIRIGTGVDRFTPAR